MSTFHDSFTLVDLSKVIQSVNRAVGRNYNSNNPILYGLFIPHLGEILDNYGIAISNDIVSVLGVLTEEDIICLNGLFGFCELHKCATCLNFKNKLSDDLWMIWNKQTKPLFTRDRRLGCQSETSNHSRQSYELQTQDLIPLSPYTPVTPNQQQNTPSHNQTYVSYMHQPEPEPVSYPYGYRYQPQPVSPPYMHQPQLMSPLYMHQPELVSSPYLHQSEPASPSYGHQSEPASLPYIQQSKPFQVQERLSVSAIGPSTRNPFTQSAPPAAFNPFIQLSINPIVQTNPPENPFTQSVSNPFHGQKMSDSNSQVDIHPPTNTGGIDNQSIMLDTTRSANQPATTSVKFCRYAEKCDIINCQFTHPSAVDCKFDTRCVKPNCPYKHSSTARIPIDCKFGTKCNNTLCIYRHPEPKAEMFNNKTMRGQDSGSKQEKPELKSAFPGKPMQEKPELKSDIPAKPRQEKPELKSVFPGKAVKSKPGKPIDKNQFSYLSERQSQEPKGRQVRFLKGGNNVKNSYPRTDKQTTETEKFI